MFNFLKEKLTKVYAHFSSKVQALFNQNRIDKATLNELYKLLISADVGVKPSQAILKNLEVALKEGKLESGSDMKSLLETQLIELLTKASPSDLTLRPSSSSTKNIILLVGINGSGKTTCAGKLAYTYIKQGKRVVLVAADTFRAAAPQQLQGWAKKTGATISLGLENQDPAAVVYEACQRFTQENFDCLIIDTAGRLQTKEPLMRELSKIKRTIERQLPHVPLTTLLTIDAMLGQNSLTQAQVFHEATPLNGIILTKLDGTGKGGIVFAIRQELGIPILYLSLGEQLDQLRSFDAVEYVATFLGK